jgi:Trypsin Inhibitor like cysteine rich domain
MVALVAGSSGRGDHSFSNAPYCFQPFNKDKIKYPAYKDYSRCANLCETTCNNIGEEFVETKTVSGRRRISNCKDGCICGEGYISDDEGRCMKQTRSSCGE